MRDDEKMDELIEELAFSETALKRHVVDVKADDRSSYDPDCLMCLAALKAGLFDDPWIEEDDT